MLQLQELPSLYSDWRQRQEDRDFRIARMDKVVRGDSTVFDPDEEAVDIRSPNMIQVALEDTAEAASTMPTVKVKPRGTGARARERASMMEKIGVSYLEASSWDRLIHETNLDTLAFGLCPWVVWPDFETNMPLIEKRDPRHCYPDPGYRPGHRVRACLLARNVYLSSLPMRERKLIVEQCGLHNVEIDGNEQVVIVEYFDEDESVVAALINTNAPTYAYSQRSPEIHFIPVELDRWENKTGVCPVVICDRVTLDGEFRGQFDQVIGILEAHMRLMGMVLDYADQAVYSDIWVRDLIGELPYGGGAYIQLGPNGAIGRVPPAVSSLDVQRDLNHLEEAVHLGSRWPKTRPGEIDQAIASAKFVEATAGIMNTAIRTQHMALARTLEAALNICYQMDVKMLPGTKVASGVLRNQEFVEEYDTKNIDLGARAEVDYGIGFGRDPAQSAVLGIQYGQSGLMSQTTVRESIEGITDLNKEMIRIDTEKFREMILAKLLQQLETDQLPPDALPKIMHAREDGKSLVSLYEEFVVKPRMDAMSGATQTGLGAGPLGPDGMPLPPELGGGPGGPTPGVPPAPGPTEMLARLGIPAGPGGTLGTQVQGQAA